VHIRVDYCSKYINTTQGSCVALLTGLTSVNCSQLCFKEILIEKSIMSVPRLFESIINTWTEDIKNNQIPRILGGLGPAHSALQLLQGIRDLVILPVEQYRKDGRIVRGLQRGAKSFTSNTVFSALDLSQSLIGSVKFLAEVKRVTKYNRVENNVEHLRK